METKEIITVYTDGSCPMNGKGGGPGGWAAIVLFPDQELILSGGEHHTSSNRMELIAMLETLRYFYLRGEKLSINFISDSQYAVNAVGQWMYKWKKRGWKKGGGVIISNKDIFEQMEHLASYHSRVSTRWVRGHSGDKYNERCDELAREQTRLFELSSI